MFCLFYNQIMLFLRRRMTLLEQGINHNLSTIGYALALLESSIYFAAHYIYGRMMLIH